MPEIAKIVIKMGKKEVTMSMDEAEKLHKTLDKLFGEKEVIVRREDHWHWDYPRPHTPWWGPAITYCDDSPKLDTGTIMCSVGEVTNV